MVSMGHFHIAPTKFPFALVSRDSDNHIFQDKKLSNILYSVLAAAAHSAAIQDKSCGCIHYQSTYK